MPAFEDHPLRRLWPPARLRVTTPRLELRLPTEEEIAALVDVALEGVHDPDTMPFAGPWTDAPRDEIARNTYAWHCQLRGAFSPARWTMLLAVFVDGEPVGAQDVGASRFQLRRELFTASWLGRRFHGSGLGTEMRAAALHLAFDTLGALGASSGAYVDNPASIRVSEKLGYVEDGVNVVVRSRGVAAPGGESHERAIEQRFRIDRDAWLLTRRDDIEVTGLDDELRVMLGLPVD